MSASASRRLCKAGSRGLRWIVLVAGLVYAIGIAAAEPILIEVAKAEANLDQRTKEPLLSLTLTEASKRPFAECTEKNIGRKAVLRVDGRVLMAPVIREPILGGSIQISGGFSAKESKDFADRIKSGSKVEVDLVE